MKKYAALAAILSLTAVGVTAFWRIHERSKPASLAHVGVLLRSIENGEAYCSGVLVSEHSVLTARHCLKSPTDLNFILEFDAAAEGASQFSAKPIAIRQPPGDTRLFPLLDLAEIRFTGDLPAGLQPIALARPGLELPKDIPLQVVGFGKTGAAHLSTVSFEKTWTGARFFGVFTARTAASDGPCFGDSGGGVYVYNQGHWQVIGLIAGTFDIFSGGRRDCANQSAVITDLRQYAEWVSGGNLPLPPAEETAIKAPGPSIADGPAALKAGQPTFADFCEARDIGSEAWLTTQMVLYAVALTPGLTPGSEPVTAFLDCTVAQRWVDAFIARGDLLRLREVASLAPLQALPNLHALTVVDGRIMDWTVLAQLPHLQRLTVVGNRHPLPIAVLLRLPELIDVDLQFLPLRGSAAEVTQLRQRAGVRTHQVPTVE